MNWVKNNKNALLWALTIIVIILIIIFSKPGDKANNEEALTNEETSTEQTGTEDAETVTATDGNVYE